MAPRLLSSYLKDRRAPSVRAYSIATIREKLDHMPRSTFFRLRRLGQLPFLEEVQPRVGRLPRYRADLVDRYVSGEWPALRTRRESVAS